MKQIYFMLVMLLGVISFGQTLPIDFETEYTWGDFDGGMMTTIANPDTNGNASAMVGQMVKNEGQPWGGSSLVLTEPMDFANNNTFTMKVWSPREGAAVLLKVENSADAGQNYEVTATTTVANQWETLTFDYSNAPDFSLDKLVLIFDNGTMGDGSADFTFFVDDIMLSYVEPQFDPLTLPITFEDENVNHEFTNFGGVEGVRIPNPDTNGNGSGFVGQAIKVEGAETWGGTFLTLGAPIDFANGTSFTVKVWSPKIATFMVKLENISDGAINSEVQVTNTMTNTWETLTFDFAGIDQTQSYQKVIFFPDFGVAGTENTLYYFDDFTQTMGQSSGDQMDLPVTFEDEGVDYGLIPFGGSSSAAIIANPDMSGGNTSATVGTMTKPEDAPLWAGTTFTASAGLGFANAIPFTESATKMNVMVWSPDAGITVRLKAEDHTTPEISVETDATTTVANAWEIIEFDFANEAEGTAALNLANTYDKVSIFFNFGVDGATAGEKTYYFDNLMFGSAMGVNDVVSTEKVAVYPNPVKAGQQVMFSGDVDMVEVYGATGQRVQAVKSHTLNTNGLTKGVYFLRITTQSGELQMQKLIVK